MTEYANGTEVWVKARIPQDGPATSNVLGRVYVFVTLETADVDVHEDPYEVRCVPIQDVRPLEVTPWPGCPDHKEKQHRDRQPPWCETCGWHRGRPATPPKQVRGA